MRNAHAPVSLAVHRRRHPLFLISIERPLRRTCATFSHRVVAREPREARDCREDDWHAFCALQSLQILCFKFLRLEGSFSTRRAKLSRADGIMTNLANIGGQCRLQNWRNTLDDTIRIRGNDRHAVAMR